MKRMFFFAAALLMAAVLPAAGKDLLSSRGNFLVLGTVTSNSPGALFEMLIGNEKARVTVTATNLVAGKTYRLLVGGMPEAQFTPNTRRKAVLVLKSSAGKGTQLLDLDPRGKVLTINDGTSNVLSLTVGTSSETTNLSYHESADLTPTPQAGAGTAEASFDETKLGVRTFGITLKGVPAGNYDVFVDGLSRGTLVVAKGTKGNIVFVSNSGKNDLLLSFDPRGVVVDVLRQGVLQFTGALLAHATGLTQGPPSTTESALSPTALGAGATGHARFITTAQCVRMFKVSVQGLPSGAYDLYVGGTNRGSLTVNSNAVTSGQVVFSTAPDGTNELLLTFAPTGQLIQLQQGTNVFFSGASSPAPAGCSVSALEVPLWNAGLIAGAQGKARYRTTDDCVQEFRVVVSGVPIGPYDLYGALAFLGSINVTTNSPANSGQIVISNPPAGFDPRGQLIEVRQGANLILSRTFPAN